MKTEKGDQFLQGKVKILNDFIMYQLYAAYSVMKGGKHRGIRYISRSELGYNDYFIIN